MLSPAAMRKVRIFVLERDVDGVTKALGEVGVVHLRSSVEEAEGRLEPEHLGGEIERCGRLMERLRGLMQRMGVAESGPPGRAAGAAVSVGQIEELVNSLQARVAEQADELTRTEQALADAEEMLRALSPYKDVRGPLSRLAESDFLAIKAGSAGPAELDGLSAAMPDGVLMVPLGERVPEEDRTVEVLVVSTRRRRFAMDTVLEEHAFEETPIPAWEEKTPAAVYREALATKRSLEETAADLRRQLQAVGRPHAQALRQASAALTLQLKLHEAQQNFGTTWATAVIAGWVPTRRAADLRRAVVRATADQAVIEIAEPDPDDIEQGRVPSHVVHSRFFAPFERLVRGYGVASYTEIEPTVMFAVSFLLMFGIIFGDLGHGLCLLAIGLLTGKLAKGGVARDAGRVIASCGVASMLFGTFFQGSFFGKSLADWGFPLTLGFQPIRFEGEGAGASEHLVRYFVLAMGLGMVLISLGTVLNIINRLRLRDYKAGLLGRFGLVGIFFYWGALAFAVKVLVAGSGAADRWLVMVLIVLPLIVLVLHEPLYALLTHERPISAEGLVMGFFQGLIEAMETVMGYLANTFSFLRVAAFALSHAALCFTIFVLQRMVDDLPGGLIWSAGVFIVGTAVIIGLEGLIVAVQIMRLEYYEFFTKFFGGDGVRYEPFRLE